MDEDVLLLMYGIIVVAIILFWIIGLSHIIVSLVGLMIGKEISISAGFSILTIMWLLTWLIKRVNDRRVMK